MADQQALTRRTYQASAATWPFTAIATTLFCMRVLSRLHLQKDALGWDDLIISVSWVFDIIRAAAFQKSLDSARQITAANLTKTVPTAAFWVIFMDAWAFLSIALPKLSIGILIIRIFRPKRWLKASIMTLCVILNITAAVGFVITFVQCDPAAGQWNPFEHPQTRFWKRAVQIVYACTVSGISAFMDIAFSIYPCIVVWGLQMPTWRKLSTMALMSLGVACFVTAVIKLISNTALLGHPDIYKLLNSGIEIGIWNGIENDCVLAAACLPTVPPVFRACKHFVNTHASSLNRRFYPTSFSSFDSSSKSRKPDDDSAKKFAPKGDMPGVYGSKVAWYRNGAPARRNEENRSHGSQEDMVPMQTFV